MPEKCRARRCLLAFFDRCAKESAASSAPGSAAASFPATVTVAFVLARSAESQPALRERAGFAHSAARPLPVGRQPAGGPFNTCVIKKKNTPVGVLFFLAEMERFEL